MSCLYSLISVLLPFSCNALVKSQLGRIASHDFLGAETDVADSMRLREIAGLTAEPANFFATATDHTAVVQWDASSVEPQVLSASAWPRKGSSSHKEKTRAMRILLTCLQASGCTMFAKLLGQNTKTMVFMDAHIYVAPSDFPRPEDLDENGADFIILKTTIQGDDVADPMNRLEQIKARFRPDRTVIFLRNPEDNLEHLRNHRSSKEVDTVCEDRASDSFGYGNRCGSPEGKLRALEMLWQARDDIFDAAVWYDDLVLDKSRWDEVTWTMNAIGVPINRSHFQMALNNAEVVKYTRQRSKRAAASFHWSTGDAVDGPIKMDKSKTEPDNEPSPRVQALSPTLSQIRDVQSHPVRAKSPLDADGRDWFRKRVNEDNELIVLFGNSDYAETMLNWFALGKASNAVKNNYAIVCLDDMLEALLRAHGEECYPARPRFYRRLDGSLGSLTPLWMLRLRVLQDLLDEGINIILSDADALWLQDPMPRLHEVAADTNADVVSSRGRYPASVGHHWGATACMGFVYFRATPGSRVLLQEMLSFAKRSMIFDDQILLNTALFNAGVRFKDIAFESSTNVDTASTTKDVLQVDGVVTLALLPHKEFVRICNGKERLVKDATVAHCVSTAGKMASTGRAKKDELAAEGLWVTPDRWAANVNATADGTENRFTPWIMALVKQFKDSPDGHAQMEQHVHLGKVLGNI